MKSFLKLSILVSLAVAPMVVPTSAWAQNVTTMADARFHEGMAFVQAGQYEQARLAFEQAYAISKDPTTLWNLALAEMKTGHTVEALRHFRDFKRDPKANATDLPTCDTMINRLEAQTCQIEVKTAAGAQITVDGEKWDESAPTKDPIDVNAGVHTIRVELGARWATKDVNGVNGQHIVITLDVGEATTLPPPRREDHPVEPPQTEEKSVAFPPPTGAIILGGVGLVGLGLGIGFGLDSKSKSDDVTAGSKRGDCGIATSAACTSLQSKNDSAKTSATIGTIGYIGGGALLAGGIVWWLVAPRKELKSTGMIVPTMGPREAGLSWIKGF